MDLDIEIIANIRLQVLNSISNTLEVEDVIFIISRINNEPSVNQGLIPYSNFKSLKNKYSLRKQVVKLIQKKCMHPALSIADEAYFFSFDIMYNVDYCFYFDFVKDKIQLFIYRKDGVLIFSNLYNDDFDERPYLFSEVIGKDVIQSEPKSTLWNNIEGLYHITHVDNLENIIKKGLLSHTIAHSLRINKRDISNQLVQAKRNHVHDKVPLFFNILNPMTYTFSNKRDLVVLKIDKMVILLPGVIFTDGNAASISTKYFTSINDLDKLNWNCINGLFWNDFTDGKRIKCAEVLVPHKITSKHIKEIFVYDDTSFNQISFLISNKSIPITINKSYYF
jgi:hypothetical protein